MSNEVEDGSVIKVHYIGSFADSEEIFDTSREEVAKENDVFNDQREYQPLEVTVGEKQVIPGFEQALIGMKVGDRKVVDIPADKAYGQPSPDRVIEVPSDQFTQADVEPQVGMMIQTSNGVALITNYDEENGQVTLDFNHPLAGKDLRFDLELVDVQ